MKKVSIILSVVTVIGILLYLAVQVSTASLGGQLLGERTIIGHVDSARVAPATLPSKLGITMDDGTYLILEHDTIVDTDTLYKVVVRETKQFWGTYSYVLSFTEANSIDTISGITR